jgi:GT2 family glycosyltransferase
MHEPPKVGVVVVASDPGQYFEECLASLASLNYPNFEVLVVNAGSNAWVESAVARLLPNARIVPAEIEAGFAAMANAGAAEHTDSALLLFCHDDVAFAVNSLSAMVEVAYATNAGVVTPKLVAFDSPRQLLAVGMDLDPLMGTAPRVEVGDLDQGQYDEVVEVAVAPGAAILVRTDLFRAIGGFDPNFSLFYEDVDLSVRARMAGARVVAAPHAKVRHKGVLSTPVGRTRWKFARRGVLHDERVALSHSRRVELKRRGQFRAVRKLETGGLRRFSTLLLLLESVVGALFYLLTARPGIALSVLRAAGTLWSERASIRDARRSVAEAGLDYRLALFSGSWLTFGRLVSALKSKPRIPVGASAQRNETEGEDRLPPSIPGLLNVPSKYLLLLVIVLSLVEARVAWASTLGLGSLTPAGPAVSLLKDYLTGNGFPVHSAAVPPAGELLLGLAGLVTLDSAGLALRVLVLASLVAGPMFAYRLAARRLPFPVARLVAILYAIGPAIAVAVANASAWQLIAYGFAPILQLLLLDAVLSQRRSARSLRIANLRLGLIVAVAFAIAAQLIIAWLIGILLQMVIYLAERDAVRIRRLLISAGYSVGSIVLVNAIWLVALVVKRPEASVLFTGRVYPGGTLVETVFGGGVVSGVPAYALAGELVFVAFTVAVVGTAGMRRAAVSAYGASSMIVLAVLSERGIFGLHPLAPAYPLIFASLFASLGCGEAFWTAMQALPKRKLGVAHVGTAAMVGVAVLVFVLAIFDLPIAAPAPSSVLGNVAPIVAGYPRHGAVMYVELGPGPYAFRGYRLGDSADFTVVNSAFPNLATGGFQTIVGGYEGLAQGLTGLSAGGLVSFGELLASQGISELAVVKQAAAPPYSNLLAGLERQVDLSAVVQTPEFSLFRIDGTVRPQRGVNKGLDIWLLEPLLALLVLGATVFVRRPRFFVRPPRRKGGTSVADLVGQGSGS